MSISPRNTGTENRKDPAYKADHTKYTSPSVANLIAEQEAAVSSYQADVVSQPSTNMDIIYGWVTCTPEETENDNFTSYTMNFDISPSAPEELKKYMVELIDRFSTFGSTTMFNAFKKHGLEPKDISLSFTDKGLKYSFSGFNTKTLDVVDLVQRTMQEINFINKMEQNAQNETWMHLLKKYYR